MRAWMSRRYPIAAALTAAGMVAFAASPSFAQLGAAPIGGVGYGDGASSGIAGGDGGFRSDIRAPIRTVTASRLSLAERLEFEASDLERRRVDMSDRQLREDISVQLEKAGVSCALRDYKRVGMTPDQQSIFEAVCDSGPGYVLVNGAYPKATSCLVLAGGAANVRRRNPEARVGAQCELPGNQNGQQVLANWARDAGVACRVDEAEWIGPNEAGFDTYEIGCAGSEGFWLEKAASGWRLMGCLQVYSEGLRCRFTDEAEQRAWMQARLAGTPAEACNVAEIRVVGVSSQGNYYETRCSTPGEGYLLRIAREEQAEDVRPCNAPGRAMACSLSVADDRSDS